MAGGSDAHGDLNYRRTGYLIRNEKINDAALGKPRNLVQVGAPAGPLLPRGGSLAPVAVHSQEQVSEALADGRFSITDGPALRIAVDLDHDGVIDDGEPTMGDVVTLDPTRSLPLLVEWKSTPEFGPVTRIDLYVGARSSQVDLGSAEHAIGRTYAPPIPGVFHHSIPGVVDGMPTPDPVVEDPPYNRMNDNYWEDPTGSLRFVPRERARGDEERRARSPAVPGDAEPAGRSLLRASLRDHRSARCGLRPSGRNRRMPDTVRLHQPDLGDREQLSLQHGDRAGHGGSGRVVQRAADDLAAESPAFLHRDRRRPLRRPHFVRELPVLRRSTPTARRRRGSASR